VSANHPNRREGRPVIRLFGALEIEGPRTLGARDLGGARPKQVLDILVAARGHRVSTDRLADLLWGDQYLVKRRRAAAFNQAASEAALVASVLQASRFRGDVTAFRLKTRERPKTGSEPAFRRNTAERVYITEAAHNPEVAGSNPAPAT
jgi:hypothetical protein